MTPLNGKRDLDPGKIRWECLVGMRQHLEGGLIPFWSARAFDAEHGGYLTWFDEMGRSLAAFQCVWTFARERFVTPVGEWRVLLDREGDGNVSNDWKVGYHTGRALLECVKRLEGLTEQAS